VKKKKKVCTVQRSNIAVLLCSAVLLNFKKNEILLLNNIKILSKKIIFN